MMTDRGTDDSQGNTPADKALASTYRHAAERDAYHELKNGGPDRASYDPTLGVTPERPDVPLSDVAHPDKADGENYAAMPSDKGPEYDRLMRGLEPGETSADGDSSPVARQAPDGSMETGARAVEVGSEANGAGREPSRYTDAELSGLEPGETSSD